MTSSPEHDSQHTYDDDSHIPVVGDMRDELDPEDGDRAASDPDGSVGTHRDSHDDSHIPVVGDMRDELDPGTDRT